VGEYGNFASHCLLRDLRPEGVFVVVLHRDDPNLSCWSIHFGWVSSDDTMGARKT
ncbi:Hypothetical predicted protein, partial [Paramuricea clavata]